MTMPPSGQWPPPPQGSPPQWTPQPPPSPKGGGRTRWVLGGLGVLVVVVVTVVTTLLVTNGRTVTSHPQSSVPQTASTSSPAGLAAPDQPIAIITTEPTCRQWNLVNNALATAEDNGWSQRDPSIPASAWRGPTRSISRSRRGFACRCGTIRATCATNSTLDSGRSLLSIRRVRSGLRASDSPLRAC